MDEKDLLLLLAASFCHVIAFDETLKKRKHSKVRVIGTLQKRGILTVSSFNSCRTNQWTGFNMIGILQ